MVKLIFLYYVLCYTSGVAGLISAALRWSLRPSPRDSRFALLSGSFGCIVVSFTAFAYLDSFKGTDLPLAIVFSILSLAGDSALIFALPFFMDSLRPPDGKKGSVRPWIAAAALAATASILAMAVPGMYAASYLTWMCMLAAIAYAICQGFLSLKALSAKAGASTPESEEGRWLSLSRLFSAASVAAFPLLIVIDFFPIRTLWLIKGFPRELRVFPLLYAFLNIAYSVLALGSFRSIKNGSSREASARAIPAAAPFSFARGLSPREAQVAALLSGGSTYKEIAWRLRIKMGTVQSHVVCVYRKLGVECKEDLMRVARGELEPRGEAPSGAGIDGPPEMG